MKNLLALTTAGRLHFLRDAITTLRDPIDVLVVDDGGPPEVGIESFCKKKKLHFITKSKPRGLTHSWNIAYRFFRDNNYDACILSNDDVRFSKGFSLDLLQGTKKFNVVCPVSNAPTRTYKDFPDQWLFRYVDIKPSRKAPNRDAIQQRLQKKFGKHPYKRIRFFNGFCFAFGKSIHRFAVSERDLFNGQLNMKNEILLRRRIDQRGGTMGLCLTSYVFHWKRGTFKELGFRDVNRLWTSPAQIKKIKVI